MSISATPYADILANLVPFDSRYLLPENRQKSHPSQWKESRTRKIPTPRSPIAKHRIVKDRTAELLKNLGRRDPPRSAHSDKSLYDSTPLDSDNDELKNKVTAIHEIIEQSHTHRLCVQPGCPIETPHSEDPFNLYAPDCLNTQPPDEILKIRDRVLAYEKAIEGTEFYRQTRAFKSTAEFKTYKEEKSRLRGVRTPLLWRLNPTPEMREAQARIEACKAAFQNSELCRLNRILVSTAEWKQYRADKICLKACWANHGIHRGAYSKGRTGQLN